MKTQKKKRRISTAVLAAIGAAGILAGFQSQVAAQSSGPRIHKPGEIRWAKGRILVQARAGLTDQELDKKIKVHGGRRVDSIEQINVHIVELPPEANERAVAQMLKADRHIKFAEVDEALLPAVTPNDPAYANAWHLPKIRTPDAWNSSVGEGVTIAILDTGVDATHPDLVANLVAGYNAYDNNSDTRDVEGHGTETAGAAAMAGNNLIGSAGVSFKSRIMPIRVTDLSATGYHSTMAKGLIWAADHGARVASMSFARVCGSSTIWNAAQYMRNKGGVVIGAAGNSGALESMAASETMTCVSATGSSDTKTSWSSYGNYVDVAAPGVGIYTTRMGGGYGSFSGTSYSAPITAAVYALMMSANRNLGPSQLDAALFSTTVDLGTGGKDTQYGYGRVDAAAAVAKVRTILSADTSAPSVAITSPADGAKVNGLVAIDVSANDNVGISRVDLYAGATHVASDTTAPYAFSWDTSALADGQSTLEARAVDAAGNMSSAQVTLTIANDLNVANDLNAPSVSITNPRAGATITGPTTVGASATDDNKVTKISLSINGKEVALSYGSSLNYQWDPYAGGGKGKGTGNKKTASGSYTLKATATDAAGNVRSTSVGVTVP
jgi:hypothetical protein